MATRFCTAVLQNQPPIKINTCCTQCADPSRSIIECEGHQYVEYGLRCRHRPVRYGRRMIQHAQDAQKFRLLLRAVLPGHGVNFSRVTIKPRCQPKIPWVRADRGRSRSQVFAHGGAALVRAKYGALLPAAASACRQLAKRVPPRCRSPSFQKCPLVAVIAGSGVRYVVLAPRRVCLLLLERRRGRRTPVAPDLFQITGPGQYYIDADRENHHNGSIVAILEGGARRLYAAPCRIAEDAK